MNDDDTTHDDDHAVRALAAGEALVVEGEIGTEVYEVLAGSLSVIRGGQRIDTIGPGDTVGEVAALSGTARTATVTALEPTVVRRVQLDPDSPHDDARRTDLEILARTRLDRHRALELISEILGIEASTAAEVIDQATWVPLAAGATLFAEGDAADAGYLVVSGRLVASKGGRAIGEIGRTEIVGETGLIDHAPRSATVSAMRDTVLARFDIDSFHAIAARHPALMRHLARTVVARSGRPDASRRRARSLAVLVVGHLDRDAIAATMLDELARHGTAIHVSGQRVEEDLGRPGIIETGSSATIPAIVEYLHGVETTHDLVMLELDPPSDDGLVSRWNQRVLTLADRVVVVIAARATAGERAQVTRLLASAPNRAERWVGLVQSADVELPSRSAEVLADLGASRIVQLRHGDQAGVRHLARLVSGNGTGLVLGGGGARGFAHLGAWRAINELGIDIDMIGGASIGAALGAAIALDQGPDQLQAAAGDLFHGLLDYTIPIVSLVKGRKIVAAIDRQLGELDVTDLWLPYFCVSTNLTTSAVQVHQSGRLATAVRASVAIPGVLPPVPWNGDLLVDGGVLNNLPCDVMLATGAIREVIAVDLGTSTGPRARSDFGLHVSGFDALRARRRKGGHRYPGIASVVMRSLIAGSSRDRQRMLEDGTIDCHLTFDMRQVGLLEFDRVEEISGEGYSSIKPQIEAWLSRRGDDATQGVVSPERT